MLVAAARGSRRVRGLMAQRWRDDVRAKRGGERGREAAGCSCSSEAVHAAAESQPLVELRAEFEGKGFTFDTKRLLAATSAHATLDAAPFSQICPSALAELTIRPVPSLSPSPGAATSRLPDLQQVNEVARRQKGVGNRAGAEKGGASSSRSEEQGGLCGRD
eukprot:598263-Rhodomonas_salina.1